MIFQQIISLKTNIPNKMHTLNPSKKKMHTLKQSIRKTEFGGITFSSVVLLVLMVAT